MLDAALVMARLPGRDEAIKNYEGLGGVLIVLWPPCLNLYANLSFLDNSICTSAILYTVHSTYSRSQKSAMTLGVLNSEIKIKQKKMGAGYVTINDIGPNGCKRLFRILKIPR